MGNGFDHDIPSPAKIALDTLALAKINLWDQMKINGTDCPCCGRFAKLYKIKISKAQMSAFNWIVVRSRYGNRFVNVQELAPKWLLRSNNHGKLVHWGLLESIHNDDDESRNTVGVWKPTEHGMSFWCGRVWIREYALVFDNKCHSFAGGKKHWMDVYDSFHYQTMMKLCAKELP